MARPRWSSRVDEQLDGEDDADGGLKTWIETLPFPLASIAYRYTANASTEDKTGRLLHLFEATAEFSAAILLSAIRSDPSLYEDQRERVARVDRGGNAPFERSSFGNWIQLSRTLAKTVRGLLGNKKERERCFRMFGVSDKRLAQGLASKKLWQILDDARKVCNSRAHGGIEGSTHRTRMLERLEGLLLDLREAIGLMFARTELVKPGEMTLSQGVFRHRAR